MQTSLSTRDRLIRAATGLFRRHGVTGTGIGAICERAGVTKGVFTHHFPSGKDELIVSVIEQNASDVRVAVAATVDGRQGADAVQRLFDGYAELFRTRGTDFGCPVAASVTDASAESGTVRRAAGQAFTSWRSAAEEPLRDLSRIEGLDALLIAALEGAILLARADSDADLMERVGRALATLIELAGSDDVG